MKKILVAEDDKYLSTAYKLKLSKSGFDVRIAADGVEVMTVLNEFVPDIVLLDLMMPNKDGFETLKEIKSQDKWKNIPVIVASNLGQAGDIDRATQLGAIDYVIKSDLSMEELLNKINSHLG
jgi:two-component system, OmpR family, alkaline phosphatase synthesis response regulator PhoP